MVLNGVDENETLEVGHMTETDASPLQNQQGMA